MVFMSPGVIDTGANLGVGNMCVCLRGCLAKFVQVRTSRVMIGKGAGRKHKIRRMDNDQLG